jgi:hypothetical protein
MTINDSAAKMTVQLMTKTEKHIKLSIQQKGRQHFVNALFVSKYYLLKIRGNIF